MKKNWDIFCKIVDNYGDIGVCWRLAKQLQREYDLNIRLYIDDLPSAQKIMVGLNVEATQQIFDKIIVLSWNEETVFTRIPEVVIEAFACGLPAEYLNNIAQQYRESTQQTTWVNLDYLSAESWIADFHAQPSSQHFLNQYPGLTRHFYFPGFTERTGGLVREKNLIEKNEQLRSNASLQNTFWQHLHMANSEHLKVSLFAYPHAPIESLLATMADSSRVIDCYVPESTILPKIARFLGLSMLQGGESYRHQNLNLHVLPFLTQADYDQLLVSCDINFVRGEDSWVRAIWAGKPFIWQPYFQEENTHLQKLTAFLDVFYGGLTIKNTVSPMHEVWTSAQLTSSVWRDYLCQLPAISAHTLQQSEQLAQQADLAAKLVIFCNKN